MHAVAGNAVQVRFALPSAVVQPYVTAYCCTDVICSPQEPWMADYLHPQWANLRLLRPGGAMSAVGAGDLRRCPAFTVTGPSSRAARFRVQSGRSWGIGLLSLGWAKLFAAEASDYADRFVDGHADPVFARLRPLARALTASEGDCAADLVLIEVHMEQLLAEPGLPDPVIGRLQAALLEPDLATVVDLAAHLGITVRSLERLSRHTFGFPPKLLIRRGAGADGSAGSSGAGVARAGRRPHLPSRASLFAIARICR